MGDGNIHRQESRNPRLRLEMIKPKYLKFIDEVFGVLGTGINIKNTAEENCKQARNRGFSPNAKPENYSDSYIWRSCSHPEFKEFADWYSTGKKLWPEDTELTPTVLKHWYCCDGSYQNSGTKNFISISMSNEVENTEKVSDLFKKSGLPSPSYRISKRKSGGKRCSAIFSVEESKKLWKYMGEPLPGFEYKWP